jgi:hypothetical protein
MIALLQRHPEIVHDVGLRLVALGAELIAGKIDDALARAKASAQQYPEWADLDKAVIDIDAAVREQSQAEQLERALMQLVWTVVAASVRDTISE